MKLRIVLPLALLILLGLGIITLSLGPRVPPAPPVPVPNGRDDFLAAAQCAVPLPDGWEKLDSPALRALVVSNAPALALVRTGLTHACLVPPIADGTKMEGHMKTLSNSKLLANIFAAEHRLALLEQRTNDAAQAALDCLRFGQENARGGPLIDCLVGVAIRAMGLARLETVLPTLDAASLRQVTASLDRLYTARETFAEVIANENRYVRSFPLNSRLAGRVSAWINGDTVMAKAEQKVTASQLRLAQTLTEAATRACQLEHGAWPTNTQMLVPSSWSDPGEHTSGDAAGEDSVRLLEKNAASENGATPLAAAEYP